MRGAAGPVTRRTLTLVIPGLFSRLAGETGASAAQTERLLSRAERYPVPGRGLAAALFAKFNIDLPPGDPLPVAPVTRAADCAGAVGAGWWLRADPVHLRADRDRLLLFDERLLGVRAEEAQALTGELNALFGQDGLRFDAPVPHRWYLHLPEDPGVRLHAPDEVTGRDVHAYLPAGPQAKRWHMLLTEAQMLMHTSTVNREREAHGAPEINSVWPWGAGTVPQRVRGEWAGVWAEEPIARGLARLAGLAVHGLPRSAQDWLGTAAPGAHLLVLEQADAAAVYGDPDAWREAIESLEEEWLAPLALALRAGQIDELALSAAGGEEFRIVRRALHRFWRRRASLSAYART